MSLSSLIGQMITLSIKNDGGDFTGKLISHNPSQGKLTLTKVTCLNNNRKLPGNQTFFQDEIIENSLVVVTDQDSSSIIDNGSLTYQRTESLEKKGRKCENNYFTRGDVNREKLELDAFHKSLQNIGNEKREANTTNLYTAVKSLPSRDEWLQKISLPYERPKTYIVIYELGDTYDEALYRISCEQTIGVSVTGVDIGRKGTLCWVQVATRDIIYLFDAYVIGKSCISSGLDKVFSSAKILKVMHDCRWFSDMLHHQYGVKLINIFDTQAAVVLVYRATNGGDLPAYVKGFKELVNDYLAVPSDELHSCKIRAAFRELDEQVWSRRPMDSLLLDYLAKYASYLIELREPIVNDILVDFYTAMDYYVNVIRDLPNEIYDSSKPQPQHVPGLFKNMLRRDNNHKAKNRKSQDICKSSSESQFIETVECPIDIIYRRDVIMHGMKDKESHDSSPQVSGVRPQNSRKSNDTTGEWKPLASGLMEKPFIKPAGLINLKRTGCVGRGRSHMLSKDSSDDDNISPGKYASKSPDISASDYDSGIDSTPARMFSYSNEGMVSGFQNYELMGISRQCADNRPKASLVKSSKPSQ